MSDILINEHDINLADYAVAKQFGDALWKHYPGWLWAVEMPDHNVLIRLLNAPVQGMCFFIPRTKLGTPDTNTKLAIWAGGEWLERCGLPRTKNLEQDEIGRVEGIALRQYTDVRAKREAQLKGDK
jgi:hypothetical protein